MSVIRNNGGVKLRSDICTLNRISFFLTSQRVIIFSWFDSLMPQIGSLKGEHGKNCCRCGNCWEKTEFSLVAVHGIVGCEMWAEKQFWSLWEEVGSTGTWTQKANRYQPIKPDQSWPVSAPLGEAVDEGWMVSDSGSGCRQGGHSCFTVVCSSRF